MKRFIGELFIFIVGFILGFGEILYLYFIEKEDMLDKNIIFFIDKMVAKTNNDFLQLLPWWSYALVIIIILLIIGVIVAEFLRTFANSKSISFLTAILYLIVTIIVAIPFARFLMVFIDGILSNYVIVITPDQVRNHLSSEGTDYDFALFSVVRGILFSILLRLQIYAFSFTYGAMLKKPVRNCRVHDCVTTGKEYEVVRTLAKRLTFDQSFSFIKNYTEELEQRHFFQIREQGLFGIGTINKWNYYRDGQIMDCSEEEFLDKLYNLTIHKTLSLKTEEEKNE